MKCVVGGAGAFVKGGVLVVVASLCRDGGERYYKSEKQGVDGRHDAPKRLQRRLTEYRREVKAVEQDHKNEETLILYSPPAGPYLKGIF